MSTATFQCTTCEEQLVLSGFNCLLDRRLHDYAYHEYANNWREDTLLGEMYNFYIESTKEPLNVANTVGICENKAYKAFMFGLFQ